jgi:protein-disulfide isomerase
VTFKRPLLSAVSLIALFLTGTPGVANAETGAAKSPATFTQAQKDEMEDFVRNFILDNPEVLIEAVNRYHQEEQRKQEETAQSALKNEQAYLSDPSLPFAGAAKPEITIYELFDYNCGYCKRAFEAVNQVIENEKNVKVVFLDLPILSPQSKTAALWSLAANKQGKYFAFHKGMMTSQAPKDEENMTAIAKEAGLDVEKLKKDAGSKDVQAELDKVSAFAGKISVTGTPAFIIGGQIIRGYVPYDAMKTIIADELKKGKTE